MTTSDPQKILDEIDAATGRCPAPKPPPQPNTAGPGDKGRPPHSTEDMFDMMSMVAGLMQTDSSDQSRPAARVEGAPLE